MKTPSKDKKTRELEAKWLKRCEEWSWNLGIAGIAKELMEEGLTYNTPEYWVLVRVFNEYFGGKGGQGVNKDGIPVISQIEAIGEILENF